MAEQNNFGKTALVAGIVLGVAAGAYGAFTMSDCKVERPQTRLDAGESKAAAGLTQVVADIEAARKKDYTIVDVAPEGANINGKPRYAPIFFSPELWQVSLDEQKATTIIDIYDPSSQNVHGDVPNHWFISNGIADALGRADGLSIDSDADGFSNREEFEAKTNPGDSSSLPSLVETGKAVKLEVVQVERSSAVIAVDSTLAYEKSPTAIGVKIFARRGDSKYVHRSKTPIPVNGTFGLDPKGSDNGRFTVVRFGEMEFSDSAGNKQTESVVYLRDNVTAGPEKEFFVRSGSPNKRNTSEHSSNDKGKDIDDVTVTLRVTAGPAVGKSEGTIAVQLNADFTVPGTNIVCKLAAVNDDGSVAIKPQNAESAVNVPKAAK